MTAKAETPAQQAARLLQRMQVEIPLTAAMQLALAAFDGETLVLAAPLAPNINDKGSAFAGSITALGSITGWSLLTLWSEREQLPCQVAVYEARFEFRKPLTGDFTATVSLPEATVRGGLVESLQRKGKGRVGLRVVLADAGGDAAYLEADYALWRA